MVLTMTKYAIEIGLINASGAGLLNSPDFLLAFDFRPFFFPKIARTGIFSANNVPSHRTSHRTNKNFTRKEPQLEEQLAEKGRRADLPFYLHYEGTVSLDDKSISNPRCSVGLQ